MAMLTRQAGRGIRCFYRALSVLALAGSILLTCILGRDDARALEIEFSGRQVKLDILALYDSKREKQPDQTRIHRFAEMPLNYLGYRVTYVDVNGRLPPAQSLSRYRGILTWFIEPLQRPEAVLNWLEQALGRDLKYVVLGEVAPPGNDSSLAQVNRLLARIGLEQRSEYVDRTWGAKVIDRDPEMIGFERPLDKVLPGFPVLATVGANAEAHLIVEGPVRNTSVRSVVVATSRDGGFATGNYCFYYEPNTDRERWTINPFAFFARAFGEERRPVPDVTTLAGRRMYFSQIDGDGWNNVSEIEGQREQQRVAAEVIEREAIVPYPDLPVSVALILGDIEPELGGLASSAAIAKRLFALPQVEVASHTHTHPFNWQFFENYDRAEEERRIEQAQTPSLTLREKLTRQILTMAGKPLPNDRTDKYIAGTDDLPRTYLRHPFDLEGDTIGAIRETERLAAPGKRLKIYQWSGDTSPFESAIKAVRRVGVRNINGGDSRYDPEYPSVSYVPPISRTVGQQRQIYAAASNENTYTNDWTGPYYGFFMLEKTLANTDSPRRLKPFDLYYHMYSGEKASALAAVKHLLELARKGRFIPVPSSDYAAIADDFFNVEIVQIDLFSWSVGRRGALATVRFDDAEQLAVDAGHSDGVLGSTRHNGALYVALDPAIDRAVVTLRGRSAELALRGGDRGAPVASLVESRWQLWGLTQEVCGFRVNARGFGTGDMVWQTAPKRGFRVTASRQGVTLSEEVRWADDQGLFAIRMAPGALEPLEIRFACHE